MSESTHYEQWINIETDRAWKNGSIVRYIKRNYKHYRLNGSCYNNLFLNKIKKIKLTFESVDSSSANLQVILIFGMSYNFNLVFVKIENGNYLRNEMFFKNFIAQLFLIILFLLCEALVVMTLWTAGWYN